MSKIKEIQSRLEKNLQTYSHLRFIVSAQIFAVSFTFYFLVYLFTIGGFYFGPFNIESLAIIRYHLYSLLIVATAFFGYALAEYFVASYAPNKKFLLIIAGIFWGIFSIVAILIHLGFISSLF